MNDQHGVRNKPVYVLAGAGEAYRNAISALIVKHTGSVLLSRIIMVLPSLLPLLGAVLSAKGGFTAARGARCQTAGQKVIVNLAANDAVNFRFEYFRTRDLSPGN